MDEDLANIIRRALDEARAVGRDDTGQTERVYLVGSGPGGAFFPRYVRLYEALAVKVVLVCVA